MKIRALARCLLAGALLVAASACETLDPTTPFEPGEVPAEGEYVIDSPDILRVTVWKHPELSIEMPVRRDGKISVPLLDDVQAAGLTPQQLKKAITQGLSASISRPNVTVAVISPDSQVVTVIGGVLQSGPVPLRKDMGVLEAAAAAGGFSAWANKDDIRVVRTVDGRRLSYRFSYRAYLAGAPEAEIFLQPGDVIVVPE